MIDPCPDVYFDLELLTKNNLCKTIYINAMKYAGGQLSISLTQWKSREFCDLRHVELQIASRRIHNNLCPGNVTITARNSGKMFIVTPTKTQKLILIDEVITEELAAEATTRRVDYDKVSITEALTVSDNNVLINHTCQEISSIDRILQSCDKKSKIRPLKSQRDELIIDVLFQNLYKNTYLSPCFIPKDTIVNMLSVQQVKSKQQCKQVQGLDWSVFDQETMRLASFSHYPSSAIKSAVLLANSGFVYIGAGNNDKVKCFYCLIEKEKWEESDDIDAVHKVLNPTCPLVGVQSLHNMATNTAALSSSIPTERSSVAALSCNMSAAAQSQPNLITAVTMSDISAVDNSSVNEGSAVLNSCTEQFDFRRNETRFLSIGNRDGRDDSNELQTSCAAKSSEIHAFSMSYITGAVGTMNEDSTMVYFDAASDINDDSPTVLFDVTSNTNEGSITVPATSFISQNIDAPNMNEDSTTVHFDATPEMSEEMTNVPTAYSILQNIDTSPAMTGASGTIPVISAITPLHRDHVNTILKGSDMRDTQHQQEMNVVENSNVPTIETSSDMRHYNTNVVTTDYLHHLSQNNNSISHHAIINSQIYSIPAMPSTSSDPTSTADNTASAPKDNPTNPNETTAQTHELTYQTLGILCTRSKHPDKAILAQRLLSFENWSESNFMKPDDLAKAGLFYVGYGDCCQCFFCGGCLRNWEKDDNAFVEHARWFENCGYICQCMGQEFVDAVLNINSESGTITFKEVEEYMSEKGQTIISMFDDPLINDAAVKTLIQYGYIKDEVIKAAQALRRNGVNLSSDEILKTLKGEQPDLFEDAMNNDTASASSKPENESIEELKEQNYSLRSNLACRICMSREVKMVFLPCGHFISCQECSFALQDCPICRAHIRASVKANFN